MRTVRSPHIYFFVKRKPTKQSAMNGLLGHKNSVLEAFMHNGGGGSYVGGNLGVRTGMWGFRVGLR